MSSFVAAVVALLIYVAAALALVGRSVWQCHDGWGVWLLYVVQRLYVPLMFRWRANNAPCPFPSQGGGLVMSNHRCPADPMMIWMNHHFRRESRNVRVIGFLTAAEYCDIKGLRWLVRTMRSIPVQRNGQDLAATREAIRRLKEGQLVGIFPEGGINLGTDLLEPNTGIAFLALKARVPVYPVFVHNAPLCEHSMIAPFLTPSRVRVTYGEPIDLSAYHDSKTSPELLVEVTNLLMSRLSALGGVGFTPARCPNAHP